MEGLLLMPIQPRSIRITGAVLMVCVVASLVDRAHASCGDWLARHASFTSAPPPFDAVPLKMFDEPLVPASVPDCFGPQCRQAPSPLPTHPQRSTVPRDHWLVMVRLVLPGIYDDVACLSSFAEGRPLRGWPQSIDRPPKS